VPPEDLACVPEGMALPEGMRVGEIRRQGECRQEWASGMARADPGGAWTGWANSVGQRTQDTQLEARSPRRRVKPSSWQEDPVRQVFGAWCGPVRRLRKFRGSWKEFLYWKD